MNDLARDDTVRFVAQCDSCRRGFVFARGLHGVLVRCPLCQEPTRLPREASALWRHVHSWYLSVRHRRRRQPGPAVTNYRDATQPRCPACDAAPDASARWLCTYCRCYWHTFTTRGVCPGCDHRWRVTSCMHCKAYSPHEEWYPRT